MLKSDDTKTTIKDLILLWRSSGVTLIPKSILFHFILPIGVLIVVSKELLVSSRRLVHDGGSSAKHRAQLLSQGFLVLGDLLLLQ